MRKLIITLNRDVLLLTLILQCHLIQYILELMEILSFRYKNRERKKEKQGLIHYLTLLTDTSLYLTTLINMYPLNEVTNRVSAKYVQHSVHPNVREYQMLSTAPKSYWKPKMKGVLGPHQQGHSYPLSRFRYAPYSY